ncbi:MAG TPA: hypothetical protein VMS17_24740 [Gemmataceae bacterium]|nr:hypothetical protein [Gemmataceae bacterium]
MNRAGKLMMILLVAVVGLWGCNQAASGQSAQADKIKTLEAKVSKLEDDLQSAIAARDNVRSQLAALQDEHTQLQDQAAALQKDVDAGKEVAKERDELKIQMQARTGERDLLQTRCAKLKAGLQSLLGQDDALTTPNATPTIAGGAGGGGQ